MTLPRVSILPSAIKRVRNYDCWIFQDELAASAPSLGAGELVEVVDRHEAFVAYAFYSPHSHIALRVLSIRHADVIDRAFFTQRLTRALARRHMLTGTNAKRLVFSEADGLPGLIVDQYAEYLVVQFRSAGMDRLRGTIVELLNDALQPRGILERSDKEFREEEGLPTATGVLAGSVPDRIGIVEDDVRFWVDPHRGLKTGFYLDQRDTRRRLRALMAPGQRVLDTFSYTGSLGIIAALRGAQVTCVEEREEFVALGKENAALNGVADRIEWIVGDAFYWLSAQADRQARVQWVILDPPALAKSKTDRQRGRGALHHVLVNGLRLLPEGGRLVLSVCTYTLLGFVEEIARIAAADCKVRVHVLAQWLQAEDHPWMLQIPPTRYLTTWLMTLDEPPAA